MKNYYLYNKNSNISMEEILKSKDYATKLNGDLFISEITDDILIDGLYINGNLTINNISSIIELKGRIIVTGNLNIQKCSGLSIIENLYVSGSINISNCHNLKEIGNKNFDTIIMADRYIDITHCNQLTDIYSTIKAHGLIINYCNSLTTIKSDIFIDNRIELINLKNLKKINSQMLVCNQLSLLNSNHIEILPMNISIHNEFTLPCGLTTILKHGFNQKQVNNYLFNKKIIIIKKIAKLLSIGLFITVMTLFIHNNKKIINLI